MCQDNALKGSRHNLLIVLEGEPEGLLARNAYLVQNGLVVSRMELAVEACPAAGSWKTLEITFRNAKGGRELGGQEELGSWIITRRVDTERDWRIILVGARRGAGQRATATADAGHAEAPVRRAIRVELTLSPDPAGADHLLDDAIIATPIAAIGVAVITLLGACLDAIHVDRH